MLKVVFVLGCLLSYALAQSTDMEHKRLARSNSDSNSNERIYRPRPPVYMPPQVIMPPTVVMPPPVVMPPQVVNPPPVVMPPPVVNPPPVVTPPTVPIPQWIKNILAFFQ
ncbi:glutelin-2-like isoform X1 [Sander lucioperca]|uniref:glutelin-2-like isoform X1 n=1 Tax=Sander lucioperca TaxID=283035 RepID=UPI00125DF96A|nr:glutelin-2-like isoform X1 [Sander lucioperca]